MIDTIVIPVAGRGTRMGEHAAHRPKHLIPVLGKPFLYFLLRAVHRAGYKKILLVIGHHGDHMRAFVDEYKSLFNGLSWVDQFKEVGTSLYGTALSVKAARLALQERPFVSLYGDSLYDERDLARMRAHDDENIHVYLSHSATPEKYGVPVVDDGVVSRIVEKPAEYISNWVSTGAYVLTPSIFDEIETLQPSARGEYELTHAIDALARKGNVRAHTLVSYWKDFGNPDDIPMMEEFLRTEV